MPLESCIGSHRASKSSRDPKTVDYRLGKQPEMAEIMSVDDALEACTGSHGASKSSRNPKTEYYSLGKRPKMPEITSYDDDARVMYWGSRGIEILPGPKNRGL